MSRLQHLEDILVKSVKTALEAYAAFVLAGGFNIVHVSTNVQTKIAGLAALVTAVYNLALKVHQSVQQGASQQSTPPVVTPPPVVPPASPVVSG